MPSTKSTSTRKSAAPGGTDVASRERMAELLVRSGRVDSKDPLVCFLYTLMRDHVTPGVVEEIMLNHMPADQTVEYSNGYLARYAEDVAVRIRRMTPTVLELPKHLAPYFRAMQRRPRG